MDLLAKIDVKQDPATSDVRKQVVPPPNKADKADKEGRRRISSANRGGMLSPRMRRARHADVKLLSDSTEKFLTELTGFEDLRHWFDRKTFQQVIARILCGYGDVEWLPVIQFIADADQFGCNPSFATLDKIVNNYLLIAKERGTNIVCPRGLYVLSDAPDFAQYVENVCEIAEKRKVLSEDLLHPLVECAMDAVDGRYFDKAGKKKTHLPNNGRAKRLFETCRRRGSEIILTGSKAKHYDKAVCTLVDGMRRKSKEHTSPNMAPLNIEGAIGHLVSLVVSAPPHDVEERGNYEAKKVMQVVQLAVVQSEIFQEGIHRLDQALDAMVKNRKEKKSTTTWASKVEQELYTIRYLLTSGGLTLTKWKEWLETFDVWIVKSVLGVEVTEGISAILSDLLGAKKVAAEIELQWEAADLSSHCYSRPVTKDECADFDKITVANSLRHICNGKGDLILVCDFMVDGKAVQYDEKGSRKLADFCKGMAVMVPGECKPEQNDLPAWVYDKAKASESTAQELRKEVPYWPLVTGTSISAYSIIDKLLRGKLCKQLLAKKAGLDLKRDSTATRYAIEWGEKQVEAISTCWYDIRLPVEGSEEYRHVARFCLEIRFGFSLKLELTTLTITPQQLSFRDSVVEQRHREFVLASLQFDPFEKQSEK